MQEVNVLLDEARVEPFYVMFGAWVAGDGADGQTHESPLPFPINGAAEWADTDEDLALARALWRKWNDRAHGLFGLLMAEPGRRYSGTELAELLDIPNGRYGVAGVLAWPGRHCGAVGRELPSRYEPDPEGGGGRYWMKPEVASLFSKAAAERDRVAAG